MKILILTPQYFPTIGGVPVLVDQWGKSREMSGHTVTVISSEQQFRKGQTGHFSAMFRPNFSELLKEIKKSDIVICLQECLNLTWPLALGIINRPCIVSLQMHPPVGVRRFTLRNLIRRKLYKKSKISACSEYIANFVKSTLSQDVKVVHNSYDIETFKNDDPVDRDIDILFVGRLAIHKRCDLILLAATMLHEQGIRPSIVIAGDGPEEKALQALAAAGNLSDVRFVGAVNSSEAAGLMRRSKILVVPSGYEPFGIVVLEGLACGCLVITSDAGGLLEAGGGFTQTFDTNDHNSLLMVLSNALTSDHSGHHSSDLIKFLENHSPDRVGRTLLALLENSGQLN